jgi:para-nitrobenzyl esterase
MNSENRSLPTSRRTFIEGASTVIALQMTGAASPLYGDTSQRSPVTDTEYGSVRGRMLGKTMGFLGVPYGGVTQGDGRFLPPSKATAWSGVRECVVAGPRAIQTAGSIFTNPVLGPYFTGGREYAKSLTDQKDSENCLALNVLTTSLRRKLPVMVYIHGGGFANGSGALTVLSDRFVSEEHVVLVGINHRLNVFGYLYIGELDPNYPDSGNIGQLDLILALKWVKDNIAHFGGDPGNVTIFGESGGGAKISTLLAMPDAKGLFHRAIIESGSLLQMSTKDAATEHAEKLLSAVGISRTQVSELQKLQAERLLEAAGSLGPMGFGAVVDGRSVPHKTWEPGAPPEANGIPLLVGNCKDEATLFSTSDPAVFSLDWNSLRAKKISSGIPADVVNALIKTYRTDYPSESPSDIFFRMSSDRGARANAIAQAEEQLTNAPGHVYMYHFDWNTPVMDGKARAFHTAELPLAMRLVCFPESEALSRQIAGAWAAFARKGNPNHKGLPHWEPYSLEKRATMMFDVENTRVLYDPASSELQLLKPYRTALL